MTHCILSVKHVRLREPVFLFLACLTVLCPYPQGLAEENTAASSEDDFLPDNPAGA
jgi:hypothetical protein